MILIILSSILPALSVTSFHFIYHFRRVLYDPHWPQICYVDRTDHYCDDPASTLVVELQACLLFMQYWGSTQGLVHARRAPCHQQHPSLSTLVLVCRLLAVFSQPWVPLLNQNRNQEEARLLCKWGFAGSRAPACLAQAQGSPVNS